MFLRYFNLDEQPFGATPDPRYLWRTNSHREALASLYCGFYGNRGFTVLIAEPGMGKTTLLFEFLEHIRNRAKTVFLFNTLCEPNDVVSFILQDLGIKPSDTVSERHQQLNAILTAEARAGRRLVLVIDEAQNLSNRALEAVRLLTNFETPRSKLMHVILAGQPELADKLARNELLQLYQRVSTICRLAPLTPSETAAYIAHRLNVAGYAGASLFSAGAIHRLTEASQGVPRIINTLSFNSLCLCRARKANRVDRGMVDEAIADLQLHVNPEPVTVTEAKSVTPPRASLARYRGRFRPTRRAAYYAAAILFAISGVLAGMHTWSKPKSTHSASSLPAVISADPLSRQAGASRAGSQKSQAVESIGTPNASGGNPLQAPGSQEGRAADPVKIKIEAGDTLKGIATSHLGTSDPTVLRQIQKLNPSITDPNHIVSGNIIQLPGSGQTSPSTAPARL
jgi:type II secretory pathway predicted ATPase ExeA